MGPGARVLADRFDPAPHPDLWSRPAAWATLDLGHAPILPLGNAGEMTPAEAAAINAALPIDEADFAPAAPFVLRATGPERARAELCLAQAIYYEAALQPLEGQQAVAQTVINRVRHPDFPKSICGVVYEGSQMPIGCQFSFTCDGSMARPPVEPYWSQAKRVAEAALNGFVATAVGPATHYHADYVFPAWGPQMVKIVQLGAHIFYRYPGPAGDPNILNASYRGHELSVSMAGPSPEAIAAAKAALEAESQSPPAIVITPVPPALVVAVAPPRPAAPVVAIATAPALSRQAPAAAYAQRSAAPAVARVRATLPAFAAPAAVDGPIATAGGDRG